MASSRRQTAELMSPYELSPACMCHPPVAPLPPPMPMPGMPIGAFVDMLFRFAARAGYTGDRAEFDRDFANALNGVGDNKYAIIVQKKSYRDFPRIGVKNGIYIDTEKAEAYYWSGEGYCLLIGGDTYIDDDYINQKIEEFFIAKIIDGGNAQTE